MSGGRSAFAPRVRSIGAVPLQPWFAAVVRASCASGKGREANFFVDEFMIRTDWRLKRKLIP